MAKAFPSCTLPSSYSIIEFIACAVIQLYLESHDPFEKKSIYYHILSEFHGSLENSTKSRMGNLKGKPTEKELLKIKEDTEHLAKKYLDLILISLFFPFIAV